MKIIKDKDLDWEEVNHPGSKVLKKVIIKNGDLLNITVFGKAVFKSHDVIEEHSHSTMYEVFHLTKGKAVFTVKDKDKIVEKGDTIIFKPNEPHKQTNPFNEDCEWIYLGLATDR